MSKFHDNYGDVLMYFWPIYEKSFVKQTQSNKFVSDSNVKINESIIKYEPYNPKAIKQFREFIKK